MYLHSKHSSCSTPQTFIESHNYALVVILSELDRFNDDAFALFIHKVKRGDHCHRGSGESVINIISESKSVSRNIALQESAKMGHDREREVVFSLVLFRIRSSCRS